MTQVCSIGIDQGSSSTKGVIVAADGTVVFRTARNVPAPKREGSRVEQRAADIAQSVRDVLDNTVREALRSGFTPRCVGFSCQRSSCLAWDEDSGEPLSSVLSWRDTRGSDIVERLSSQGEMIVNATGLPLTPYYSASKLSWLKSNLSRNMTPSIVLGTLSSFLCQHLTGRKRALIDHTNAARTQLMNIRTLEWDDALLGLFDLRGVRLPEIVPTEQDFGVIVTAAGPLPLCTVIGDQQAAMLGLGVTNDGDGGINYGTGGFLMTNTGSRLALVRGLMASVHYSQPNSVRFLLEGSVNAAGDGLAWLRDRFGLFHLDEEVEGLCRKANDDVVVFLGLNGTGAPHWERSISTAIHGLTANSTPSDIVRGVIEGIAFFMTDIALAMRAGGVDPRSFIVSGGLSSIPYLLETQAALLDRPLFLSSESESSALGAAFLAGVREGMWSISEAGKWVKSQECLKPAHNSGIHQRYRRWKQLHRMTAEIDGTL